MSIIAVAPHTEREYALTLNTFFGAAAALSEMCARGFIGWLITAQTVSLQCARSMKPWNVRTAPLFCHCHDLIKLIVGVLHSSFHFFFRRGLAKSFAENYSTIEVCSKQSDIRSGLLRWEASHILLIFVLRAMRRRSETVKKFFMIFMILMTLFFDSQFY